MIVLTKYAVSHMKRGSTIVNSTSVTVRISLADLQATSRADFVWDAKAYKGSAGMLDYSATKGAISTFT